MRVYAFLLSIAWSLLLDDEQNAVDQYVPELDCTGRDSYGYPSCFTVVEDNGKLYFRLSSYGYSRTRANDACNVMGGYLAVTKSDRENDAINRLLQAEVAPAIFAVMNDLQNAESWIGLTLMSSMTSSKWYGVTCRSFHICQSYELSPLTHFLWNDCDDETCTMCNEECSQTPSYQWHGFGSFDPEEEKCMAYTPQSTNTNNPVSGETAYYWKRETCTNKYPALCSIDLAAQGCTAFGYNDISSKKWITAQDENWIDYAYCDLGQKVTGSCDATTQIFDEDSGCAPKVCLQTPVLFPS